MSRTEIFARYRQLRLINKRHSSAMLKFVAKPTLLEHARGLGLADGRMLLLDNENELPLVFDLAIYSPISARSRAIDRYRKATQLAPDSDEAKVLDAMCQAEFSVWRVERRHETAGLVVFDLLRQVERWVVDEAFEQTAPAGMVIAMRLFAPESFAMTAGVFVPVDRNIVDEAIANLPPRRSTEPDALAKDPRFAMAIYRAAITHGVMERVAFV
jgi:hypothetical protein